MSLKHNVSVIAACAILALPMGASADGHATADTVVATVNSTEITLGHMIVLKQRLPAQYQQLPPNVLFDGIMDQLVQQTLLGETVESLSTAARLSLDNEERALKAAERIQGLSEEAVTDEALQAAYEEAYGSTEPEVEFNASHILVETEDEAKALIAELEGDADFAQLAIDKSTGPSGPRGGELGWFGLGAMVAPFEEAVATMEPGDISTPVQTQFGWHVIKLNETRVKNAPPLEQVQAQLSDEIRRAAIESLVEELTASATVTRATAEEVDPALLDNFELLEN